MNLVNEKKPCIIFKIAHCYYQFEDEQKENVISTHNNNISTLISALFFFSISSILSRTTELSNNLFSKAYNEFYKLEEIFQTILFVIGARIFDLTNKVLDFVIGLLLT